MSGIREIAWPRWGSLEPSKAVRRRSEIIVGCVVFIYDVNTRVYPNRSAGPAPRHFFVPREVIGETSRSWVVGWPGRGDKHPKAAPAWLYGLDDVEDALWVNEHSYRLSQHISRIKDADQLREIARMTGFKP